MSLFFESPHFLDIEPIEGAVESIFLLSKYFDLQIVTSRSFDIEDKTKVWVQTYFGSMFSAIHFGNHYGAYGEKRSKPQMCADIHALLLVDDSSIYAKQCAESSIPVILFGHYAWNQWTKGEEERLSSDATIARFIQRVSGWKEAIAAVADILKQRIESVLDDNRLQSCSRFLEDQSSSPM